MAELSDERILLIGMMGAGKTTIGRLLAGRLGWRFFDSDQRVKATTGKTVRQLFAEQGEVAFRAEETRVLAEAAASNGPLVVSVAGGAVLSAANRGLISGAGLVIWLRCQMGTLTRRVGRGEGRPLLDGDAAAALTRLYRERRPLYEQLADVTIDVDTLSPEEIVARAVGAWHARGEAVQQEGPGGA